MQIIPLQAVPAQAFSITLDGNQWDIAVKLAGGAICFTFTLNNALLIENTRAVAGYRLIPFDYLQNGNFALITTGFEVPDYTQFGNTQQLIYISPDEIAAIPEPLKGPRITLADFDPNGAIPLRFAPQGYKLA